MNVYAVRVFQQGIQQGQPLHISARSAEEAINEVEARLGLEPACARIDKETGKMAVTSWHGCEFRARLVRNETP